METRTDGREARVLFVALALVLVWPASPALGQGRDALRECFGPGPLSIEETRMTCTRVGNGEWEPVQGPGTGSSAFDGLFFVALLLSLLPAFVGAAVASSAKLAPVAGFLIGLFASWLGVIALYLYGHWQKSSAAARPEPAAAAKTEADVATSAADRLRRLQELRDQGLITHEEYVARRQATVDNL